LKIKTYLNRSCPAFRSSAIFTTIAFAPTLSFA
jgi:hypothetical protein